VLKYISPPDTKYLLPAVLLPADLEVAMDDELKCILELGVGVIIAFVEIPTL
jgi:hypothetical protein